MKRMLILKLVYLLFAVGLVGALFVTLFIEGKPAAELRELESAHFEAKWTKYPITLPPYSPSSRPFLIVKKDCVVLADSHYSIKCLDIVSGEIRWQTKISGFATIITSNRNFIFVKSAARTKQQCATTFTPQCDAIHIAAYDIVSGQILWSETYQGLNVVSQMSADDSKLILKGGGGHGAYSAAMTIDVSNGDLLIYEESGPVFSQPAHEKFFVFEGRNVISNSAISERTVYFLTHDAVLWARDGNTNEVLGRADFEPSQSPVAEIYKFQVAAEDDVIVIYLGDSQQLFTLQFFKE